MRVILLQTQLSKKYDNRNGWGREASIPQKHGISSHMPQKKNYIKLLKNGCHYVSTSLMKD